MKNLIRKILENPTMMSWASYFIQFGNLLIILPLMLNKFTEAEQNVWFFFNFIMGIAVLADGGFGPTILRAYSYFKAGATKIPRDKKEYQQAERIKDARPNYEGLRNLLTTTFRVYLIIGLVVSVLLATGGVALTMNLMEQAGHRIDLWISYGLFAVYCVITINTTRWSSATRGLDYVAYTGRLNTLLGVIKTIGFFIILLLNRGILWLVCFNLLEAVIKNMVLRNFVMKWFSQQGIEINQRYHFDGEIFRSIWKTTWNQGLTFVALYIIGYLDTLIVGQLNDSRDINRFFITKRIFTFIKGFSRAPFYANVQRIYSIGATKNFTELRKRSAVYIFYSMVLVIGAFVAVGLFGNMILSLFTETRLVTFGIYLIMALTIVLDFHSSFHADIYLSTNHFPFLLPAGLTGLTIGLLSIPAATHFGILGIVTVPLVISMAVNNWYPVYLSFKLTGWNMWSYTRDLFTFGIKDFKNRFATIL